MVEISIGVEICKCKMRKINVTLRKMLKECLLLNFVVAQASKGKHRHLFISGTWFLKFFSKFLQNELVLLKYFLNWKEN